MAVEKLIVDHIDTWTTARQTRSTAGRGSSGKIDLYGIKKLRELILELAVRGKLVPQDSNDEPASELLRGMKKQQEDLIKEKKIKKPKKLPPIDEILESISIPQGWELCYLNDIGDWGAGATPNRTNSGYYGGNIPWFKSGELSEDYITDSEEHITALALKECSLRDNQPGDVLIAMYGATIGKTSILNTRSTSNQAVCACTPFDGLSNQYLLTFLKASKRVFTSMGAGGAQPNISKEKIVATQFALPPLKEQLRIVEKVEQLMSLCDQLEQHSLTSLDAHQQLVDTLLTTLTESQNADELAGNWARISEHFDTLFTTEASIDALKKTILQLAVMGKLVPQDPNDEPASELLKRIAQEKAQLMKDGKIKKQKQLPPIGDEEKPFELPDGWEWCRIGNLVNIRPELVAPDEYQSLPQIAPDIIEKGTGKVTAKRTVKESGVKGPNSRFYKGQIVYSKIRPSLSKAFLAEYDGLCSADMYPLDCFIDRSYLLKSILSEFFLIQVRQAENRIKMPKLNVESFSNILVTVPPSNEQQKIIMKLAAIDAFCDKAKSLIQSAQQTQLHLADALTDAAIN
ncbi:restriction endonuclease subunit S [Salmonella enterica]|uniref:Restriction endonuclease subunit S n=4 Tax=Salmonella enterica TaxID=28901 RepID=A0A702LP11_SALHO|nr:restriction endonuclease subunit S [Salmonella enterica subsp. houtenae]EAA9524245.1 restriction endonuclease subunit S [Salmonella enterica]ECH8278321.1 restriction endonuclease subunit S [Salmonella enterica subsp. enterica]EDQ1014224.1 restriction endonuclease subunit S [Salmonella enterica subsp. houtenae serovar 50:z4,z23:-]EDW0437728.1 restriction endonuclease subunit S [Salmonella enterica subsp. arizonae serovar 50:z4,z23:-]EEH1857422.1 restriction endonuclease subunit S [Salmonella